MSSKNDQMKRIKCMSLIFAKWCCWSACSISKWSACSISKWNEKELFLLTNGANKSEVVACDEGLKGEELAIII